MTAEVGIGSRIRIIDQPEAPSVYAGRAGTVEGIVAEVGTVLVRVDELHVALPFALSEVETFEERLFRVVPTTWLRDWDRRVRPS